MNKLLISILVIIVPAVLLLLGYVAMNPNAFDSKDSPTDVGPNYLQPDASETTSEPETNTPVTGVDPKELGSFSVAEVIDGDTIMVSDGTEFLTVRIIGIDSPETIHAPSGAECFNTEATLEADRLLAGQTVMLFGDPTQDTFDAYNRLLAYVTLPDGTDFGEQMIKGGFAKEYTFKGRSYIKQTIYKAAEASAKAAAAGLWGCD